MQRAPRLQPRDQVQSSVQLQVPNCRVTMMPRSRKEKTYTAMAAFCEMWQVSWLSNLWS